jgi:rod shape-determining protein MreC
MIDVPKHVDVKKGDSVFTNNFSYFPPDVLIGTVIRTEIDQKKGMKLIYMLSSTNFHSLQYVYVIDNKMTLEKKNLEDSSKKAK